MGKYIKEKTFLSIDQFIDRFKLKFFGMTLLSDDVVDINITPNIYKNINSQKEINEKQRSLIKLFTNGYCYHFALILKGIYPEGHICYHYDHGHIVYLYDNKFWDINGELTDKRNRYIPIEYLGEFIDDFKQYCNGGWARKADILRMYKKAQKDNNILSYNNTTINEIHL